MSLLWLAPTTALLVLNHKHHVIGASIWCPGGRCSANALEVDATQRASKLDRNDHNALGALQFVAKALEIWFFIIATTLLYDVAMLFARRGGGLPVGFFLTHLEFGDVRNLLNPLMWTAPVSHKHWGARGATTAKLYLFAILAAFLTILVNLMGPATAVLVLPTLQWVDTPRMPVEIFKDTALSASPKGDEVFTGCTAVNLDVYNYTCTLDMYGSNLDRWANSAIESRKQTENNNGTFLPGSSQEGIFEFTLNFTNDLALFWVPNRRVLLSLMNDTGSLWNAHENKIYNNSLRTLFQRQGPSIGVQTAFYVGNISQFEITPDRYVRCYTGWSVDWTSTSNETFTKCIKVGDGWSATNTWKSFNLTEANSNQNATTVVSLFSDQAIVYNEARDFGSGIISCLDDASAPDCDWEKIFNTRLPAYFQNTTTNLGITEYHDLGRSDNLAVWCESVVYLSFPTYTFDTSSSNLHALVQLNNITDFADPGDPQIVNPAWLLAAWSTRHNGIVDGHRPMAKEINRILPTVIDSWDYANASYDQLEFFLLNAYTMGQSLSMVPYTADNATAPDGSVTPDAAHPLLSRYATLRVWAYGINSRTSRLGVVVVLAGCGCVLLRLVLGFVIPAHNQSTVEMFVAALEHFPKGEFHGLAGEHQWAKVRYQLDESVHGKPVFHRPTASG